jgi:hypothetical protein
MAMLASSHCISVFEILLEVTAGKSWKEAFLHVLPPRKGAVERAEVIKEELNTMSETQLQSNIEPP